MIQPQRLFTLGGHWIKKPNALNKSAAGLPTLLRHDN
jgi:hypothetical protein